MTGEGGGPTNTTGVQNRKPKTVKKTQAPAAKQAQVAE